MVENAENRLEAETFSINNTKREFGISQM